MNVTKQIPQKILRVFKDVLCTNFQGCTVNGARIINTSDVGTTGSNDIILIGRLQRPKMSNEQPILPKFHDNLFK